MTAIPPLIGSLVLGAAVLLSASTGSSGTNAPSSEVAKTLSTNEFIFPSNQDVGKIQLLECPTHNFGKWQNGLEELQKRLADKNADKPALIQLCVFYQPESLLVYAPKMDWVGINPFASLETKYPVPNVEKVDLKSGNYWGDCIHPVLARLRLLNSTTPENCRLLARVDLSHKEPGIWNKRPPSQLELRWCAVALCGAGYNGVIWVGKNDRNAPMTTAIEKEFKAIDKAIVNLKPVGEQVEATGVYATLLENDDKYVLCVLSKDYVKIIDDKTGNTPTNVSSTLDNEAAVPFQVSLKGVEADELTRPASQALVRNSIQKDVAWRAGSSELVLETKLVGPANIWIWDKAKGAATKE